MAELGAGSLTWRHYGDLPIILMGQWMVSMHSMWPPLGAAIEQTANLLQNPIQRAWRSMDDVEGLVYSGDSNVGKRIRDYHRTVSAQIGDDSRVAVPPGHYHSMEPQTFYWAHACFFMALMISIERFNGALTQQQRDQLYVESVEWYRLYGVTMRPVPKSWDEFTIYWEDMCARLSVTPTTESLMTMKPEGFSGWLARPALVGARWIADGCMPEVVRKAADRQWTARDERALVRLGVTVGLLMRFVPPRFRWHEAAYMALYGKRKGRWANGVSVIVAGSILTAAGVQSRLLHRKDVLVAQW